MRRSRWHLSHLRASQCSQCQQSLVQVDCGPPGTGRRSVEHTLAHTIDGLCFRIIAKITGVTLRLFLRRLFGIEVLTYTVVHA